MTERAQVRVTRRYQIALPRQARQRLNIQAGDRLLVDVQDGLIILIPQPQDMTAHLSGLHREIWDGVDVDDYLEKERETWDASATC